MSGAIAGAVLDHIVINARTGLDRAERLFRALGFALTPRGHHTLGSINHLAVFATDYLELIGLPEGAAARRPEIGLAPAGLNGLVFRSRDIAATHAHLARLGAAGGPPNSFSRPVTLADGATREARFRTVATGAADFPPGRLYFCQHLTPELLWRPEWQAHPNRVTGFAELVAVAREPAALAARLASVTGAPPPETVAEGMRIALADGFVLSFLAPAAYRARFGGLARDLGERAAMLGAVAFRSADLDGMARFLDAAGVAPEMRAEAGGGLAAALGALDTLVVFRPG